MSSGPVAMGIIFGLEMQSLGAGASLIATAIALIIAYRALRKL